MGLLCVNSVVNHNILKIKFCCWWRRFFTSVVCTGWSTQVRGDFPGLDLVSDPAQYGEITYDFESEKVARGSRFGAHLRYTSVHRRGAG